MALWADRATCGDVRPLDRWTAAPEPVALRRSVCRAGPHRGEPMFPRGLRGRCAALDALLRAESVLSYGAAPFSPLHHREQLPARRTGAAHLCGAAGPSICP
ncbi:hypothetical protein GCM10010304_39730 [Streptomyces roseoviolaceus]